MYTKTQRLCGAALIVILTTACGSSDQRRPSLGQPDPSEALAFSSGAEHFGPIDRSTVQSPYSSMDLGTDEAETDTDRLGVDGPPCDTTWVRLVEETFVLAGFATEQIETTSLGNGCQSQSSNPTRTLTVKLETAPASTIDDVVASRSSSLPLRGFTELAFSSTDGHASSSLLHIELDRLVENRWARVSPTEAIRIELSIDKSGLALRRTVLRELDKIEATAVLYERARIQEFDPSNPTVSVNQDRDAVVSVLEVVLGRVAETVQLGSLATDQGADSIAFEYAFPENFAALVDRREHYDCRVVGDTAECTVSEVANSYHFTFIRANDTWLLHDFALDASQ